MELAERRKASQRQAQARYYAKLKRGRELLRKERQETRQLIENTGE